MRRLAALLFAGTTLLLIPLPAASAQEPPAIRLTLVSQTPWNSLADQVVDVRIRAQNTGGQSIDQLSLGVTLFGPLSSRTEYEASLSQDPSSAIITAETLAREGTLAPDGSRVFEVRLDLSGTTVSRDRSLVYPLRIDLRSGFTPLAVLRTPVIFLVRRPETPLSLSWTFVLSQPIQTGPDGIFRSPELERQLEPGGRLAGEIRSLTALVQSTSSAPVDVAISPMLVTQLVSMRSGYRVRDGSTIRQVQAGKAGSAAASDAVADLRAVADASQVELSAMPFSEPRIPALESGGLAGDLPVQLQRGRDTISAGLSAIPDPSILRPPDSALDQTSLDALSGQGVSLLLVDPNTAPQPEQPQGFAPPAVAELPTRDGSVTAIVPDPSVQALLQSDMMSEDPVRAAQAVLGELAQIWLELPGTERGVAVMIGEDLSAEGAFFGPLVRGISQAPWLKKVPATVLAQRFPPSASTSLAELGTGTFTRSYVEAIKQARRRVAIYRSMLVQDSTEPDLLDRQLLLAEAGQFVFNEGEGLAFVNGVRDTVGTIFDRVRADTRRENTLTSSSGKVFVPITNGNDVPLRVTVQLLSPHLRESPSTTTVLPAGASQTLDFDVQLNTTGRFPVDVQIASPSGRVIGQATLIVRSTAYNRIALFITIGAALVALALWARRFLPRRTS